MNAWRSGAWIVVVAGACVGCGSAVSLPDVGDAGTSTDASGGDAIVGDVGAGSDATLDGGDAASDASGEVAIDAASDAPFDAGASCPSSPPTGPCASNGLTCSYPGACSSGGTLTMKCNGSHWGMTADSCPPPPIDGGTDAGSPTCPASEPMQDSACGALGTVCTYPAPGCPSGTDEAVQCDSSGWNITHVDCSGSDGGGGGAACPSALPSDGSSCSNDGLVCGYGDDPRPSCRSQSTCDGTSWTVDAAACTAPPTTVCPISEALASGFACSTPGAFCTYGDTICGCSNCGPGPCGGAAKWTCAAPPTTTGCPSALPNLGVACSTEGVSCAYGSCGDGTSAGRVCMGGVWVDQSAVCPG